MKFGFYLLAALLISYNSLWAQNYKLLESTSDHVKIEFDFNGVYNIADTVINGNTFQLIKGNSYPLGNAGDPWLPAYFIDLGIPTNSTPTVKILELDKTSFTNKRILPLPEEDTATTPINTNSYNERIYGSNNFYPSTPAEIIDNFIYRYSNIIVLNASPFQYNPVTRQLNYNKKIVVEVDFTMPLDKAATSRKINDPETNKFIKNNIVNKIEALNWTNQLVPARKVAGTENYWYNPSKDYYKIYVRNKGIYRITFDQLIASGVPVNNVSLEKLELMCLFMFLIQIMTAFLIQEIT